jgi:uncharacterized protein (TIGR03437 family)
VYFFMQSTLVATFFAVALISSVEAQPTICSPSAVPTIVRSEGLTERVGDILYRCTGVPNTAFTVNLSISLNTNITNRISAGNMLTGIITTVDSGSGPQPLLTPPLLSGQNMLLYNGARLALSPQGVLALTVSGIRANANRVPLNTSILAFLAGDLPLTSTQLVVGSTERGLYAAFSNVLVCAQYGSPLPQTINFANLLHADTSFASTRVTEGFTKGFGTRDAPANLNADTGDRIIVRYSGFPSDARLFVPDVIAGSDAVTPTAGGDFELPASGGAYAVSAGGSLLLARVSGANASGAGGTIVFSPASIGSQTATFNSVSELSIVNGATYVVYEVVDSNLNAIESAQFPTFLGLLPDGNRIASETSTEVFYAPLSTVSDASATEPLPRFAAVKPPADCGIIGDCATYLPHLSIDAPPLQFTGSIPQQGYFTIRNTGGGKMPWTASVSYANGSGWLSLDIYSAGNGANVRVFLVPGTLAPGTYKANLTIDAGPIAGSATLPVTLVVTAPAASPAPSSAPVPPALPTAAPHTPAPIITSVVNSASFAEVPVVPGSLTTLFGSAFGGANLAVTFDALPATILYQDDQQINLIVPAELRSQTAQLVVRVDGISSAARTAAIGTFEPAIFKGAILNPDMTVNDTGHGAAAGTTIALWATGLSGTGTITAHVHDRDIDRLPYAGPAPGIPGVQQVNLQIPGDLPAMTTDIYICGMDTHGVRTCSIPSRVTIAK